MNKTLLNELEAHHIDEETLVRYMMQATEVFSDEDDLRDIDLQVKFKIAAGRAAHGDAKALDLIVEQYGYMMLEHIDPLSPESRSAQTEFLPLLTTVIDRSKTVID
ncbi:hypothetical protein [Bifidobacterium felsineum]|uniref:hypothetical protein n=1 Tax=Bifidobacterium felsineum TaxID=2045440 RepID=UPI001BDD3678|nr:hypothetical protein [Bifidobacterium felsineum]MBT1164609.1 hypothetical protein [Bifidobacterium felsineum]